MEKNFFPNETINKALNLFTAGSTNATIRRLLRAELEQEMSYMVVDRSTGTLIGAQINSELTPAVTADRTELFKELMATHRKWLALFVCLLINKWLAFAAVQQELYPDDMFKVCKTDSIFEQHMCTFLPAFQRQGLFKLSVRLAHDMAVARGFSAELALATTAASKAVLLPLGFHVHREVALRDVIFDGQPIMCSPKSDTSLFIMINDLLKESSSEYFLV